MLAVRPAGIAGLAHKNTAAQISSCRNDHGVSPVISAQMRAHSAHRVVPDVHSRDLGLLDFQILRLFQQLLHIGVVFAPVRLHAQGMDGRPFSHVQHAALQKSGVRRNPHHTAQRVDLPHKMSLGRASDGRIAGQIPDAVQREREQRRLRTQLRRGAGGFYSRVPCTDDHNFITA